MRPPPFVASPKDAADRAITVLPTVTATRMRLRMRPSDMELLKDATRRRGEVLSSASTTCEVAKSQELSVPTGAAVGGLREDRPWRIDASAAGQRVSAGAIGNGPTTASGLSP